MTEKAENLRTWGYEAISVFWPVSEWNDDVRSELMSLESRTGVRPVEFALMGDIYGKAMSLDEDLREQCRAMYRQAVQVCAALGAVTEIEFEYGPQFPLPLFDPFQQLSAEQEDAFITFYRELLDCAAGSDARVLLEPINRYESKYLNRLVDNARIVDAVAHPNAGLLPDTFHMSLEESDLGKALRSVGDQIVHMHLGDSNRLLPGHGHLDWSSIFGALKDVRYDGYLNLECSTEGDPATTLPATASFLRQLIAG